MNSNIKHKLIDNNEFYNLITKLAGKIAMGQHARLGRLYDHDCGNVFKRECTCGVDDSKRLLALIKEYETWDGRYFNFQNDRNLE